jgi:hypothetical protein
MCGIRYNVARFLASPASFRGHFAQLWTPEGFYCTIVEISHVFFCVLVQIGASDCPFMLLPVQRRFFGEHSLATEVLFVAHRPHRSGKNALAYYLGFCVYLSFFRPLHVAVSAVFSSLFLPSLRHRSGDRVPILFAQRQVL